MWTWLGPSLHDDNAVDCVLPVLWMTLCLAIIGQANAMPIGRILKVTHQGAARAKCDVCDCLVRIRELEGSQC